MIGQLLSAALILTGSADPTVHDHVKAALERTRYREVAIHPRGEQVAALTYHRSVDDATIYPVLTLYAVAAKREGGEATREVARHELPPGQYGYFRWSPDGAGLAFLRWGNRWTEVWHWRLGSAPPVEILYGEAGDPVFNLFWQHGSGEVSPRLIVLRTTERGRTCELVPVQIRRRKLAAPLAMIRGIFIKDAVLSRDGSRLAFVGAFEPGNRPEGTPLDLFVMSLPDGPPRRLTDGSGIADKPAFGPDNRQLACSWTPAKTLFASCKREILLFEGEEYESRVVTSDLAVSVGDGIFGTNERLWFTPDGRELMFANQDGMADHVLAIDLAEGGVRRCSAGDYSYKKFVLAEQHGWGVSVQSGPAVPERLFLHRLDQGTGEVVDAPNAGLRRLGLARPELVSFAGSDGLVMEGLLLRPPGTLAPHPLLVILHGGSSGRHTLRFNNAFSQVYASLGYAVFLPNTRGSAGYGRDFGQANVGDFGGCEVDDVLCGVEALVQRGLADPQRLSLYGHSYGGYLVQMVLARSDRFKAACSEAGVSDWLEFYHTSDLSGLAVQGLGGTPEEQPEAYRSASPLTHADRMRTPLLFVHGAWDRRVPPAQSRRMHAALRERGIDSDLKVINNEGHLLRSQRDVLDVIDSVHAWFQQHGAAPE